MHLAAMSKLDIVSTCLSFLYSSGQYILPLYREYEGTPVVEEDSADEGVS